MNHDDYVGEHSVINLPFHLLIRLSPGRDFTVYFDVAGTPTNWVVKDELRCVAFGVDISNEYPRQLLLREIYRQAENVSVQIEDQKILERYRYLHPYDD